MKKVNQSFGKKVYEAPKTDVIQMTMQACVLASSDPADIGINGNGFQFNTGTGSW